MLQFFRRLSSTWLGPAIMGTLLLAFLLLGSTSIRGMFSGHLAGAVVQAGPRSVSEVEFRNMFESKEQEYLQRTGQPFPLEEAVKEGVDKQILQSLADATAYNAFLQEAGLRPSDEVLRTEFARAAQSDPKSGFAQLFDPITHKLDEQAYARFLTSIKMSRPQFEQAFRDDIATHSAEDALMQGLAPARIYAAAQATLALESRDVTYFVIPDASIPKPNPTDAQLAAFLANSPNRPTLPERRTVTLVRFSAKAVEASMPVDPAAVQQQFEAQKSRYAKPELRTLVEIPLNDPSKAAQVAAALSRGDDPQTVAKSVGVDAIPYADQPQTAIADRKAAAAAFALKEGQVSGPVQGDFKTVILKVTKITPATAPDLAAARSEIETQLRQSEAIDKVYDLSQKFEDLRQGGATLKDAAAKLGLSVSTVGPITQDGKDIMGQPPTPPLSPKVLSTAFQTGSGGDSDVEQDTDKGEYYALHVDQVIAAGPPKLTDPGIKPLVQQAFISQTIGQALQKKATDAQAAIQKGQSFEAVAAANGGHVTRQLDLKQAAAQPYVQTLGRQFLVDISQAKQGQAFVLHSEELKGAVVARVDAIRPPDPKQVATFVDMLRERAGNNYVSGIQEALRASAVKAVKPTSNLDLARQAMNVDADMLARATGKAAGAAK